MAENLPTGSDIEQGRGGLITPFTPYSSALEIQEHPVLNAIPNHWSDRHPRLTGIAIALGVLATIATGAAAGYEAGGGQADLTAIGAVVGIAILGFRGFIRSATGRPRPLPRPPTKFRVKL